MASSAGGGIDLEMDCVICQSTLQNGDDMFAMACGHSFHRCCIDTYVEAAGTPLEKWRPTVDNLEGGNQAMMVAEGWHTAVLSFLRVRAGRIPSRAGRTEGDGGREELP